MENALSFLPLTVLIAASAAASYFDYRERRIPNWIPRLCLAFSLVAALLSNAPALYYALVLAAFLFAFALYSVGAWAGGDAKFFTAALALAGLARFPRGLPDLLLIAWVFLLAAALAVPFALAARRERAWRERRVFFGAAFAGVKDAVGGAFAGGLVYCAGFFVFAWRLDGLAGSLAAGAVVAFVASFGLRAAFFAAGLLKEKILLGKVKEGIVPAETVYLDSKGELRYWGFKDSLRAVLKGGGLQPPGRVLCDSRRARGLNASEARELKRVFKQRGVKFLLARDSLPFAPQVAVAAVFFSVVALLAP